MEVTLVNRRVAARYSFIALVCIGTIAQLAYAILKTTSIPGSNQYCFATAFFTGIFLSTFFTNLMRIGLNSCLASKGRPQWLLSKEAVQVARDMLAVRQVCKLMNSQDSTCQFMTVNHNRKDTEQAASAILDEKNNRSPVVFDSARAVEVQQKKEVEVNSEASLEDYQPHTEPVNSQRISKSLREADAKGVWMQDLVRHSADKNARLGRYSSIIEADNAGPFDKSKDKKA